MDTTRWEGIAQDLLDASLCGEAPPVDALELAACCGLTVRCSDVSGALLYDDTIYVSRRTPVAELHIRVAHEIGHWALGRDRAENSEEAADYLAAALLVPRRSLISALRGGWDLDALRAVHVHAPAAVIADRIAQLRDATAAIYDERRLRRRVGPAFARERELVDAALERGGPVREDDLTGAWPVPGSGRRVIVLAGAHANS